MPFFEHNDLRTHYEFTQNPGRPVLVFSNSLGATLTMWDAQVAELAAHYSILRYDARGHGASSVPEGPYNVEQLSQDLLALLDHLGLERVHLCGLSMGGAVAQWIGANAGDRLAKLVLASTAAKFGTAAGWNERIATVLEDGMVSIAGATMERWFTEGFRWRERELVAKVRQEFESCDPLGYTAACAVVRDADSRGSLERITAPTLIIFGPQDSTTTGIDAGFLAEHIADSKVTEVDGAHLLNIEHPEAFNRALREFLGG
ncbi:3-oxoadipate enol-lactonase [Bryocella elongata]|uniref:3-oxoadipate enol-lactonase n=1 Tax=Bryocella elongata TaxID=863522 RepID=A0A1H5TRP5_9BACT|nr:3-oxoadipate enol-lactonase [Bryocella elongata]SEF65463.1 3-oxoadipate enol-lactonase [Bryocella elongata]